MQSKNKNATETNKKKTNTGSKENKVSGENVVAAQDEALSDIGQDPDYSVHSPNDDLDEGETARLGEDKTDLV
jgi:hypothetical protein